MKMITDGEQSQMK